jgi:transcriptional regulator with XRE-family HTH domain
MAWITKYYFGEKLKDALAFLDLTQKDLAKKSGVTEVSISNYIKGKRKPDYETFVKISKALEDEFKLWLFSSNLIGKAIKE